MRTLIVEDSFAERKALKDMLLKYGECDIAVNGEEALDAFKSARQADAPYDLMCLDIMMPGMNGHEVLTAVRDLEALEQIDPMDGIKVMITTGYSDRRNVMQAFNEGCESYLIKPVVEARLISELMKLNLVTQE